MRVFFFAIDQLLWQCYDEIHRQQQDRRIKNGRQIVFYDDKLSNRPYAEMAAFILFFCSYLN